MTRSVVGIYRKLFAVYTNTTSKRRGSLRQSLVVPSAAANQLARSTSSKASSFRHRSGKSSAARCRVVSDQRRSGATWSERFVGGEAKTREANESQLERARARRNAN